MTSDSIKTGAILSVLAVVLAVPFLFRPAGETPPANAPALVIISPHNEAVRKEFDTAFRRFQRERYGQDVAIDWRNIGGTSEIVRYLDGEYEAAKRVAKEGIGIDLFFGGGQYDHAKQADKQHTVPCGVRERHPEWLTDAVIPQQFSGETYYDTNDCWYGCCLTSFGICYNEDVIRRRRIEPVPSRWSDLADYRFFRQIALADPTKSGSINKAFEMLIQQQMMISLTSRKLIPSQACEADLGEGWRQAMGLLRRIGANARYFSDAAGKVPVDVAQGNAAAGMCIDYYGRFESETIERTEGVARMKYIMPAGGSSISADPISLLRGAPHRELAERFIDFTLSPEGQLLWNYRAGTAGGPVRYTLRRLPIRKDMYTPGHLAQMADPDALPYQQAGEFVYQPGWTGSLFGLIRLLIRSMCMDTHDELVAAWRAIHEAGGPEQCPEAMAAFLSLPPGADYAGARNRTASEIRDKRAEVRVMREWTVFFKEQYQEARQLAGKGNR